MRKKKLGYDAVFVYGDNCVEAEAVGCKLHFPEKAYPYIKQYVVDDYKKFNHLPLPDPQKDGRMPQLLKAAKLLREQVGQELPVIGILLGPMSIAGQLMGLEKLLYLLLDSPQEFERFLDYTSQISLDFGLALLQAGIHIPAILDPSASQSVIPSEIFLRFLLPRYQYIFNCFESAQPLASWLIITGNTKDLLPYYPQCGINIASIDYEVDVQDAFNSAPELIFAGNIKPFTFVNDSPQQIIRQGKRLVSLAGKSKGFILSSGCEVPLDTKQENITALVNTVRGDLNC